MGNAARKKRKSRRNNNQKIVSSDYLHTRDATELKPADYIRPKAGWFLAISGILASSLLEKYFNAPLLLSISTIVVFLLCGIFYSSIKKSKYWRFALWGMILYSVAVAGTYPLWRPAVVTVSPKAFTIGPSITRPMTIAVTNNTDTTRHMVSLTVEKSHSALSFNINGDLYGFSLGSESKNFFTIPLIEPQKTLRFEIIANNNDTRAMGELRFTVSDGLDEPGILGPHLKDGNNRDPQFPF